MSIPSRRKILGPAVLPHSTDAREPRKASLDSRPGMGAAEGRGHAAGEPVDWGVSWDSLWKRDRPQRPSAPVWM